MTGRTDFAQLRTFEIAARMGVRFNHNHRGEKNVNALEIRRMERELEALQTKLDADPARLGECGPAMRLLEERLIDAYIEQAKNSPFEHTRDDAAFEIRRLRQNHRPDPAERGGRLLAIVSGAALVVVCVLMLMQATGTLAP